jgi:hypothetical protein
VLNQSPITSVNKVAGPATKAIPHPLQIEIFWTLLSVSLGSDGGFFNETKYLCHRHQTADSRGNVGANGIGRYLKFAADHK